MKISSFDVFDTLLLRKCIYPTVIFQIMQEKLKKEKNINDNFFIENFSLIRQDSEKKLRGLSKSEDITFDEIYEYIDKVHFLKDDIINYIKSLEITTEEENLFPNPLIYPILEKARSESNEICFISDMYLDSKFVRSQLTKYELIKGNEKIYMSSELRKTKFTGNMYKYLSEVENFSFENWIHYGDNKHSDIEVPRKFGIRTYYIDHALPNNYESSIIDSNKKSPIHIKSHYYAALSRFTRLSLEDKGIINENNRETIELGVSLAGPIFLLFTEWILQKARQLKAKKIYFVARDGEILFEIAKRISQDDINLKYIYGSRQAWRQASINYDNYNKALSWIFDLEDHPRITLNTILFRAGIINGASKNRILKQFKIKLNDYLSNTQVNQLKNFFLVDVDIKQAIIDNSNFNNSLFIDYLKQERCFDSESYIIVDIGWKGSMLDIFKKTILQSSHYIEINMLFFGLFSSIENEFSYDKQAYLFDSRISDMDNYPINFSAEILELLSSATHPSTISYKIDNGSLMPVFLFKNDDLNHFFVKNIRTGIDSFIDNYTKSKLDFDLIDLDLMRKLISKSLSILFNPKTVNQVKPFLSLSFSSDQANSVHLPLAKPLRLLDLFIFGDLTRTHSFWINGSLAVSPQYIRILYKVRSTLFFYLKKILF